MADPTIPRDWRPIWTGDIEDQYGRRSMSGTSMPARNGPMYDPGGWGGTDLPGLTETPWRDLSSNASASANALMMALAAPGYWKALTLPVAAPFVGAWGKDAYRNSQQINGDHPTQLNQQHWTSQVENALARLLQSGGYK